MCLSRWLRVPLSLTIAVKQQETKQPRMRHSSPNVDHSAAHRERNIWATIHQHLLRPPWQTQHFLLQLGLPYQWSTATNQTWAVHYAVPALKLIRIGSVEIHTDLWTHHTPIHWRRGASGHIRLSALRAKSRSFKIFQPNHMQHGCSLITIMSILSGKHHKQTKTKSNEERTEWGQNKKGSRFLCWRF